VTEQATTVNLEVLEQKAERALEKAEQGWREFAETMREIKQSGAHEEAGYRYFQTYYRQRWEEHTGRTFRAHAAILRKLTAIEEFEAALGQPREVDLPMPGASAAELLKNRIPEPEQRVEAWRHHLASERGVGKDREGLRESIAEYKGEPIGVIEQAEDRGIVVPDEPKGKTPSEAAWLAMATASRVIRGVEPADAARVESGRVAARYVEQMTELAEWTTLFVHELRLYVEEHGEGR
jgi:hypothetical protein